MNKRPITVTIIAWLFIVAGVVGLVYHATEFKPARPFENDAIWICFVRLLAIIGGAYMLRAQNWARWLGIAWMVWHVVLSAFHSASQLITHLLMLVAFTYFLFRPHASAYFRHGPTQTAVSCPSDSPAAEGQSEAGRGIGSGNQETKDRSML